MAKNQITIVPVEQRRSKRFRREPDSDESTVLCPPQKAVPKRKRANRQQYTPMAHCRTSAFQPVSPRSSLVEALQSIAEQNPRQESKNVVTVITPPIALVVRTYISLNIRTRTVTTFEAEMQSDSDNI